MASSPSHAPHAFATTHWSLVIAAGVKRSPDASAALTTLCERYWYPLYAYVRRRGLSIDDAGDLTQGFFAHLLETDAMQVATPERGRFRSFLLSSLNNYLANHWRKAAALKRGGGRPVLSLDFNAGEQRYVSEPSHELTPERIYERRWALTLLEQVLEALSNEYAANGKGALLEHLKPYLAGAAENVPYGELAATIGMTEGSIKVAVHRLRRRCGELLRAQIAQTVADPGEIDEELRHLFAALRAE